MARNASTFIALGSPAARVMDALSESVWVHCDHKHTKKDDIDPDECPHVAVLGLDEVAVAIADMIEKGELA